MQRVTSAIVAAILLQIVASCGFSGPDPASGDDANPKSDAKAPVFDAAPMQFDAMPTRVTAGLVARWNFDSLEPVPPASPNDPGDSVLDTISTPAAAHLRTQGNKPGLNIANGGISVTLGGGTKKFQASNLAITKFKNGCSDSYTLEIWFAQGSNSDQNNLFWLGTTTQDNIGIRIKSENSGNNDAKLAVAFRSNNGATMLENRGEQSMELGQTKHQLVVRRLASGSTSIFIDGANRFSLSTGSPATWPASQQLHFFHSPAPGNESKDWSGTIYMAAFYCSALTDIEISSHFNLPLKSEAP
jgi:hypothetical protein